MGEDKESVSLKQVTCRNKIRCARARVFVCDISTLITFQSGELAVGQLSRIVGNVEWDMLFGALGCYHPPSLASLSSTISIPALCHLICKELFFLNNLTFPVEKQCCFHICTGKRYNAVSLSEEIILPNKQLSHYSLPVASWGGTVCPVLFSCIVFLVLYLVVYLPWCSWTICASSMWPYWYCMFLYQCTVCFTEMKVNGPNK